MEHRETHFKTDSPTKGFSEKRSKVKKWDYPFLTDLICGGLSGGIAKTAVAPFERCKLIMQTENLNKSKKFTSTFHTLLHLARNEGFLSLWRGNVSNILRYVPNQALIFAFKDTLRPILSRYDPEKQFWKLLGANLFCSGVAGGLSLLIVYPLDFVRTRLAVDFGRLEIDRQFKGITDCIRKIYSCEGIPGLYRGFGMSVQGFIIYKGSAYGGYDTIKSIIPSDMSFLVRLLIAQGVTVASGFISYPWDTVTRRMMMESGRSERNYKGSLNCFYRMAREEGIRSFFNGFVPNILRCVGGSLVLVVYDELQTFCISINVSE